MTNDQPSAKLLAGASLLRTAMREEVMPRLGNLRPEEIVETQPHDFTTVADTANEKYLSAGCDLLFPGAYKIGEEETKDNPAVLLHAGDNHVICIDPVDATSRFKDGEPGFGSFMDELHNGRTEAAWILVVHKEQAVWDNRIIMAERGKGVWVSHGIGQAFERLPRFDERPAANVEKPVGLCDFKYFVPEYPFLPGHAERRAAGETVIDWRRASGSARYYSELALGRAEIVFSSASKPWDHASSMVIEELGGIVTTMFGAPYSPTRWWDGVAAAANRQIYDLAFADTVKYLPDGTPRIEPALERFRLPTPDDLRKILTNSSVFGSVVPFLGNDKPAL